MTDAPPGKVFGTRITYKDRVTVLMVSGELDISTVPGFAEVSRPAAESVDAGLIVDLSDVRFLSSSAITELVRTFEHLPEHAVMALVATAGVVVRPVRLSGIDRVMSTFDDVSAAADYVQGRSGSTSA